LLKLRVVDFDIGEAIVSYGRQLAVVLDLIFQARQLIDNLLSLLGDGWVLALGCGSVDVVDGLGLGLEA
jgi:hypothetical protein